MPIDHWSAPPAVAPHGYGFSVPVAVTQTGDGTEAAPTRWEGIRVEVRSLAAVDIAAGIAADPDATDEHLPEALAAAGEAVTPLATALARALEHTQTHVEGEAWTQPAGAHDAYPAGAVVTHDGVPWVSLTAFNVWTPGASGWRQVVPEHAPPPAWVQPAGGHDAYPAGATVTHDGTTWTSSVDGNVWAPGVYGWVADQ